MQNWSGSNTRLLLFALSITLALGIFESHEEKSADAMPYSGFSPGNSTGANLSEPIQPIVPPNISNIAKVELGRDLFNEKHLSADGTISCSSCHNLARGGADGRQFALGSHGKTGSINTPTVLNASLNMVQFWDGRATNLESQADGPITNQVLPVLTKKRLFTG